MNGLDYLSALLLGTVQGLTEFLPISSSGHLAVVQSWLALDPDSQVMLLFDVLVHCGTLVAILYVFRWQVIRFIYGLSRESSRSWTAERHTWRVALVCLMALIPTGVIGLVFQDTFEAAFDSRVTIGICLIVTGVLLALLVKFGRGRRGWKQFRWWEGVLIGLAQALAIFPGISRSGATICMASYCGWRRRWAVQFSFLIAIPAIAGGTFLKLRDVTAASNESALSAPWGPMIVGGLTALVVGIVALHLLINAARRGRLHFFAIYCWLAGGSLLIFGR